MTETRALYVTRDNTTLDRLCALHVMGWTIDSYQDGSYIWYRRDGVQHIATVAWKPTTNIAQAWQVQTRVAALGFQEAYARALIRMIGLGDYVSVLDSGIEIHLHGNALDGPIIVGWIAAASAHARVLAALSAVGIQVEPLTGYVQHPR